MRDEPPTMYMPKAVQAILNTYCDQVDAAIRGQPSREQVRKNVAALDCVKCLSPHCLGGLQDFAVALWAYNYDPDNCPAFVICEEEPT